MCNHYFELNSYFLRGFFETLCFIYLYHVFYYTIWKVINYYRLLLQVYFDNYERIYSNNYENIYKNKIKNVEVRVWL